MHYLKRKIIPEVKNIKEFLEMLAEGEFLIPAFQRYFVWDAQHIVSLWDSILHFYPIGSILYWQTSVRLNIQRRIGGFLLPVFEDGRKPYRYILDGQQRVTSLFVSYFGGKGRVKGHSDSNYALFFDLTRGEFCFEDDIYKRRENADLSLFVKLADVPYLPSDYVNGLVGVRGYSASVMENWRQVRHVFSEYNIQLIQLKGFDISSVCDVYERINQAGVRLENLDILVARNFRNYDTLIEEDFES